MQGLAHASFHYLVVLGIDPTDGTFGLIASLGNVDADISQVRFRQAGPLVRHLETHRVPVTYTQLATLPWFGFQAEDEKSSLERFTGACFVPLAAGGDLVGILVLGGAETQGRGKQDLPSGLELQPLVSFIEETQRDRLAAPKSGPPGQVAGTARPIDHAQGLEETADGIAHDMGNILTAILSHVQMLEVGPYDSASAGWAESAEANMDEEGGRARPHLAAIRMAALDGAESVRQMRRIGHATVGPPHQVLDVNELVCTTLDMLAPGWRRGRFRSLLAGGVSLQSRESRSRARIAAPVALKVDLGSAGHVLGDPPELRRVLTNLIANAVDALPPDGGHLEIVSGRAGGSTTITVRDNGHGVPPHIQKRIFQPGFTTKGPDGRGLGLSICRTIVGQHGGTLKLESVEGEGATFTVLLPPSS